MSRRGARVLRSDSLQEETPIMPSPRRPFRAALVLLLAVPVAAAADRLPRQYTIEQVMATTWVGGASFSPDETKLLSSSDESGIRNVYVVPVGGGAAVPLTQSTTDSTIAVSFFPNDERILFTRDRGGNELNHLYVRERGG